ncbi:MAG: WYL domain-containing protein [Spirochaetales bacterium]|nr:WYL domain-containing protein [Spirochaetales bacterium]
MTISQLQQQLETSRRSVYRLLDTLQDLSFPLYEDKNDPGPAKIWKLEEQYLTELPDISLSELRLTKEEIILLFFLFSRGNIFKKTKLEKYLFSLKNKFDVFLPANLRTEQAIAKLDDIFIPHSPDLKDYSSKEEILDDLTDSIVRYKRCIVTYHSLAANKDKIFQIDPLKMFEHGSGLYVFVRVIKYMSISILSVERINKITVLESRFEYPAGFNPEEILDATSLFSFGDPVTARIWFSSEQADYIKERQWAPKQEIEEQADGSVILSLSTSGLFDVKKWILSFGASAKVIGPEDFARDVNEEILKMMRNYTL